MKFFVAFTVLFAVASARVLPPAVIASDNPEVQEIIAAIQNPSTDPATAAALEQMLLDVLGLGDIKPDPVEVVDNYEPISVGPAIVDDYEPISVGPAIVDNYEPISVGPAIVEDGVLSPAPLVQIIIKINQALADAIGGSPVVVDTINTPEPTPVQVVDVAETPEQVIVVDSPIVAEPVVVDQPESVIVAEPIISVPAIVHPDILN